MVQLGISTCATLLLSALVLQSAEGLAMYMLEGKHCATPLQEGAQMMGYKTRRGGPDRPVLVLRGSEQLKPGDHYVPGERLTIQLGGTGGQWVAEATAGSFEHGGCEGQRRGLGESRPRSATLVLPEDGLDVSVRIAYAGKYGPVDITEDFLLKGGGFRGMQGKNLLWSSLRVVFCVLVLTVLSEGRSIMRVRTPVTKRTNRAWFGGPHGMRSHPRGPLCAAVLPGPLTRPLVRLGSAYSNWLLRNPVVSNFISGTVIVALGDAISQFVEGNAKSLGDLDQRRLFNAGVAGVVFNGVLLPSWYVLLHKVWPVETPRTIAYKIACNCVAWGCIGNGAIMLMRRMLDGASFDDAMFHVKKDLKGVMMNDYKVWPLYDVLCFTVIPRHTQATFTGALGMVWAAYLSYVSHDAPAVATS